jgi:hypothetical protein
MQLGKLNRLIVMCICMMLVVGATGTVSIRAKDAANNPLLDMLRYVPNTPETLGAELGYLDFRALIAARSGAVNITSTQEWLTADQDTEEFGLFMAVLLGVNAGDADILQYIIQAEQTVALTGFDPFAVDRHLTFGAPPGNGTILSGQFDQAAMEQAFTALGYTVTKDDDTTLICSPNGCDDGYRQDLSKRDPVNVFGGNLGRMEPIFLAPGTLINSANNAVLAQSVSLYKQAQSADTYATLGLAGNPDYFAAASYFSQQSLLQAYFLPAAYVDSPLTLIGDRLTAAQRAELLERLRRDFQPFPAYTLMGLAHIHAGEDQLVLVALVYEDRADAEVAASTLPARLEAYQSIRVRKPLLELIEERGGTFEGATVVEVGERYLTVLTIRAPIETNEKVDGRFLPSGLLFRSFTSFWMTRDLGWLVTQLPE